MNIRDEIIAKRKARIKWLGHEMGVSVPVARQVPVTVFGARYALICEVKKRSPSKGAIAADADPVAQAGIYISQGVKNISVLTEEEYFGGSLADLMAIKRAHPQAAILRKDFLVDVLDVDVSFRAGADAVLLIASALTGEQFGEMLARVKELGINALVEVHSREDVYKVAPFAPALMGINSRDLATFRIDPAIPFMTRSHISWHADVVYESGIFTHEDAVTALSSGFAGLLVGEAVMKNPGLVKDLLGAFAAAAPGRRDFWQRLYARKAKFAIADTQNHIPMPLVKICGITNRRDAEAASAAGADMLGFILAPSPRRTTPGFVRCCADLPVLRAGAVVAGADARLDADAAALLEEGFLDVIQFHGDEEPGACYKSAFPYYKAVRLASKEDCARLAEYRAPRTLVDAFAPDARGGTGKTIPEELVLEAAKVRPLWLAGGIGPDNFIDICSRFAPELVDIASRIEKEPGVKDHEKLKEIFRLREEL